MCWCEKHETKKIIKPIFVRGGNVNVKFSPSDGGQNGNYNQTSANKGMRGGSGEGTRGEAKFAQFVITHCNNWMSSEFSTSF